MHPFWSSHKEKRVCVRLSMGGQPWLDLSSWKAAMGSSPERGRRGKEEGEGHSCSVAGGLGLLLLCPWSPPASCSVAAARLLDVRRRSRAEERKEKREKRKEKMKEKNRKIAKLENFREEK
jgi:hypothetical protein